MKPEHLAEATKLVEAICVTKEQHHQLSISDDLSVNFFNRQVKITKDDPKFENVKRSMLTFLDLRLAEQYRRANQIGLNIQPVVLAEPAHAPEPVKEPGKPARLRDIKPDDPNAGTWREAADGLFKKPD